MAATAIEYEAKILDIDPHTLAQAIVDQGGTVQGWALQRRYVYDIDPADPSRWVRLRDTGSQTTLTVKEIASDDIGGTRETEITVSNFDTAHALLAKLGYRAKAYQENRRQSFLLDGAQLEIDTWPRIPPYLEIEAADRAEVLRVAALLGYTENQLTGENTTKIYTRYGIDLTAITNLCFNPQDE